MAIDLTPENFRGASFSEEEMEKIMAKMQVNFFISSSQKLQHLECSQEWDQLHPDSIRFECRTKTRLQHYQSRLRVD